MLWGSEFDIEENGEMVPQSLMYEYRTIQQHLNDLTEMGIQLDCPETVELVLSRLESFNELSNSVKNELTRRFGQSECSNSYYRSYKGHML